MLGRALAIGILALTLPWPALAGSKAIVTPRLIPPSDGSLTCGVVNASESSTLEVEVTIHDAVGDIVTGPSPLSMPPLGGDFVITGIDGARLCVVRPKVGKLKNARVSLYVRDSAGLVQAALSAPSK